LTQATRAREQAAKALGAWSHAQFESLKQDVGRMIEQGRLQEACAAAEQLLNRALAAGEAAYVEAAGDIAMAYLLWGRSLHTIGAAEAALTPLNEARRRFQARADAGNDSAKRLTSTVITEAAGCLGDLGRFDEAATAFEESIRRDEKLGAHRGVAVARSNLSMVFLRQKRYGEALENLREALKVFESLGDPDSVAISWNQIGRAHHEAGQFEQAEQAYRQSLAMKVQQQDILGEAASLGDLGSLYDQIGRLEEAATFYRQAANLYARLQDHRHEGVCCYGLAYTLIKLQHYDDARREIHRAIERIQPFGYTAEPWKAWHVLHILEHATGDAQAAAVAREQAIASYLDYRRAGGEGKSNEARLCALTFQAIQRGATTEEEEILVGLLKEYLPICPLPLLANLLAILRGDRNPALAADPNLDFYNAVELKLLLEALETK